MSHVTVIALVSLWPGLQLIIFDLLGVFTHSPNPASSNKQIQNAIMYLPQFRDPVFPC